MAKWALLQFFQHVGHIGDFDFAVFDSQWLYWGAFVWAYEFAAGLRQSVCMKEIYDWNNAFIAR